MNHSVKCIDVSDRCLRHSGWSPCPDSNRGPFPYQGNALPPELHGRGATQFDFICYKLGVPMPTIDDALASARRRFTRLTAVQANSERAAGALLVDTRTESQRR